jgi:hypothetical protein
MLAIDDDRLAFTKREAARVYGIPLAHFTLAVRNGELSTHCISPSRTGRALLLRADVEAWIRHHPAPHDRRKRTPAP